jgi:uncharacterized protein (TIGR00369 family)
VETPKLNAAEVAAFIESAWAGALDSFVVEEISPRSARVRLRYHERMLRPGGTVSGPSLMALADTAMWAAVLGAIGPIAMTVTTHLDIDFLRFVGPHDVVADVHLLKLGRRLAVGEVLMTADGATEPCARASLTYSIPPEAGSHGG